jgi:hypothetical protein
MSSGSKYEPLSCMDVLLTRGLGNSGVGEVCVG